MSNHSGSYMLNDVLSMLEKRGILENIGMEGAQKLIIDVVELGDRYDCNPGEILEGFDDNYRICMHCLEVKEKVRDGCCKDCWYGDEDFDEEDNSED